MKTLRSRFSLAVFLLGLAAGVFGLSGCTTAESDNMSARPWNQPQNWENGLPSTMMEGH